MGLPSPSSWYTPPPPPPPPSPPLSNVVLQTNTTQGYPGTYTIFVFIATSRNLTFALAAGPTRTWGGSPTAALLKAGLSISQVATGPPPLGVPEDVLIKWIKLGAAYQRRCVLPRQPLQVVPVLDVAKTGAVNVAGPRSSKADNRTPSEPRRGDLPPQSHGVECEPSVAAPG